MKGRGLRAQHLTCSAAERETLTELADGWQVIRLAKGITSQHTTTTGRWAG